MALVILNDKAEVLLGRRAGTQVWQLPQGGIEGDTLIEAAFKEAKEELGIDRRSLIPIDVLDFVNTYNFKSPKNYGDSYYKGQTQRFVVFKYVGSGISLADASSNELDAVKWVKLEEFPKHSDTIRQKSYEHVLLELQQKDIINRVREKA